MERGNERPRRSEQAGFTGLQDGEYTITAVTPGSGSDYMVLRGFDANTGAAITTAIATADEYPALREGRYRLPSWDYANSSANNTSVKVQAQFSREYEVWRSPGTLGGDRRAPTLAVLQVYDTKLSASDSLGDLPGIKARMQGRYSSTYNDTLTWTPDWTREPDSEETRSATPVGTISWASKSVTFSFPGDGSIPAGAGVVVRKDTTVCADHACELDFNRTGTPGPSARETTLTVTAENGYDDHIYSVVVARANPVDNELFSDRVRRHNAGGRVKGCVKRETAYLSFGDPNHSNRERTPGKGTPPHEGRYAREHREVQRTAVGDAGADDPR